MPTTAHPIDTLRQYVTELEAAILLCLDKPDKKPVHRLRTMTRRIEAQIALLDILHVPKTHSREARNARRLLKKIRRAAAEVRDLDVQQDHIADHIPANAGADARQLSEHLASERTKSAEKLVEALKKHQASLSETLESLVKAFSKAGPLTLTAGQLSALTLNWFERNAPAPSDDPDSLHTIRKKAKIARYLAENAPKEARSARRIAEAFESLQELGGEWHDWLILSGIAREHAGESSRLTRAFAQRCARTLASYRHRLAIHLPTAPEGRPASSRQRGPTAPPSQYPRRTVSRAEASASDHPRALHAG
jgi:CHAD domain-containing protein